ncbi:unnamed protein product, partial [Ixodes pacificus]
LDLPLSESESSLEEMVALETMRSRCLAVMPESFAADAFLVALPPLRPLLPSPSPPSLRLCLLRSTHSFLFFLRDGLSSPSEPAACFLRFFFSFFSLFSAFSPSPPSSLLSLT